MSATSSTTTEAFPEGFFGEFESHTYEAWREAAEALLKGAPFDKVMMTKTLEGFAIQPLYRQKDVADLPHLGNFPGVGRPVRGQTAAGYRGRSWEISQELVCATPEEFNAVALHDLMRGQTELNILLDVATRTGRDPDVASVGEVGGCGLSLASLSDVEKAFEGIHLDMISSYFRVGSSGVPVAALLVALANKKGIPVDKLRGCIEMDPLGSLAGKGSLVVGLDQAMKEMAALTTYAAVNAPGLQTIGVQGTVYADGGASVVQELTFALATGVEYLKRLSEAGFTPASAARHLRMALSVGSNFFLEIAKFRAARLLWDQVLEGFGVPAEERALHLHARTATYNKTQLDPHANMLRVTSEAFAAVVGGCDSLHVSPFDEVTRMPDAFSRRIARNVQIILMEECDLTQVLDPAGGSYAVESLTHEVAQSAWGLFQEVEKLGGMAKALAEGFPQEQVAATAKQRQKLLAQRREVLVGTNQYPNGQEKPLEVRLPDYDALRSKRSRAVAEHRTSAPDAADADVLEKLARLLDIGGEGMIEAAVAAVEAGATLGEVSRTLRHEAGSVIAYTPIRSIRLAQPYEELRAKSREYAQAKGHGPRLLQANLGPSRGYRIRADWTAAFFLAGGFEVLSDTDFETDEAVVEALRESASKIAVLTSSDEIYAERVVGVTKAIKTALPGTYVVVAGNPGEHEAAWREAGVDDFVHVRVNHYEMNRTLLERVLG